MSTSLHCAHCGRPALTFVWVGNLAYHPECTHGPGLAQFPPDYPDGPDREPQPEARELTDDELRNLWINRPSIHNGELVPQLYDFARAVLAAAKGKP